MGDRLLRDRRGTIGVMVALTMTVLMGTTALALEVGSWAVAKVELQRRADLAAFAAAARYRLGDTAQVAATAAADVAALNGATATSRSWSAASNTLTANDVTAQLVNGVRNSANPAMKVVVTRSMPLSFGKYLTSRLGSATEQPKTAVTVRATAYAEIVSTGGGGGQPCLVALNPSGPGITMSGGATIAASGCTVRSNSAVSISNGTTINADWVYTNTVSVIGGSSITDGTTTVTANNVGAWNQAKPLYTSAGQISDPYAGNTSLAAAFKALSPGQGKTFSGTWQASTLTPSILGDPSTYYASITSASGSMTFAPGLYIVNGNVTIGNSATVTGSGVTIVASGTITFGGGANVTLSAPDQNSTSGIPGIVIASNSTASTNLANGTKPTLTGVIYYPNGSLQLAGGVKVANNCLEVIAGSLSITNGTSLASNCSNYGATNFGSLTSTTSAMLVQ